MYNIRRSLCSIGYFKPPEIAQGLRQDNGPSLGMYSSHSPGEAPVLRWTQWETEQMATAKERTTTG